MKNKFLSILTTMFLFVSANAVATPKFKMNLLGVGFAAPEVNDEANVPNPEIGAIILDSSVGDGAFKGYNGTGWVPFGGAAAPTLSVKTTTVANNGYTFISTDDLITADTGSGAFSLNLPSASGFVGKVFYIKKIGTNTAALTLNAADNIDNAGSVILNAPDEGITAVSDGSTWRVIARAQVTGSLLATKASVSVTNATAKITSWTNTVSPTGAIAYDSGNDRYTINKTGVYELSMYFEISGSGTQGFGYKINGGTYQSVTKNTGFTGSDTTDHDVNGTTLISLNAGDYIEYYYSASSSKTASNARVTLVLRN